MANWDIGDSLTLTVSFTNASSVLTSPTTVVLTVKAPNGTTTTPVVTNDSTGVYHATYAPTMDGNHWYRWDGTGALTVAEEGGFYVRPRKVP